MRGGGNQGGIIHVRDTPLLCGVVCCLQHQRIGAARFETESSMFSGFDQFTEGFKRFSLDALQQQEEEEASKSGIGPDEVGASALAPVPEQPSEAPPEIQPSAVKDSGLRFPGQGVHVDSQVRKGAPQHEIEANPEPNPMSGQRTFSDATTATAVVAGHNARRAESPPAALAAVEGEKCAGADNATEWDQAHGKLRFGQEAAERVFRQVVHKRGETHEHRAAIATESGRLGARPTCGDSPAAAEEVEEIVSDKTVRVRGLTASVSQFLSAVWCRILYFPVQRYHRYQGIYHTWYMLFYFT